MHKKQDITMAASTVSFSLKTAKALDITKDS